MTAKDEGLDGFFSPSDLAFLQAVVSEVCPKLERKGEDRRAALVAAAAVELYQKGVSDHHAMVDRLRSI